MRQKKRKQRKGGTVERKAIIRSASMMLSLRGKPKGHDRGYESQCKCFPATTDRQKPHEGLLNTKIKKVLG